MLHPSEIHHLRWPSSQYAGHRCWFHRDTGFTAGVSTQGHLGNFAVALECEGC
jgi:hypothetical protein